RSIEHDCWDPTRRVEQMGAMGVQRQVLSPMPELLSYWLPADDARDLASFMNERIAEMVQAAPDRFHGLGMVTLQEPELAAAQLGGIVRDLGLRGVEIGSNVNGRPLGDPAFEPFFAEAEAQGA